MESIPLIICGRKLTGKNNLHTFDTSDGKLQIGLPNISDKDVMEIKSFDKSEMHDLDIDEVISFLVKAGKLWQSKTYEKREELVDLTSKITGYSREMIELGMLQISHILSKDFMEKTLENELGDKRLLDEWLPKGNFSVHCQPRGTVLHVLSGNVPVVSVMSLVRGLLTENVNILKMPSRDLVTASYFVQSFSDVDESHPITKSTSVVYWPQDSELLDKFLSLANCVCTWGGKDAVEAIRKKAPYGVELLEFGPRIGIQLIGKEVFGNLKEATIRAAHDLTLFDQEACFSPQLCFVEGNVEKYAKSLSESLVEENQRLPKGFSTPDMHAVISHTRSLEQFRGRKVFSSNKTDWTLIIGNKPSEITTHPLGRTLYLFPVKNLKDALKFVSPETQVVAIEPFSRSVVLREELTNRGVDRLTILGRMGYFPAGAPQDGMYPLSRMVRWVKTRM